ncbi:Uncharacterized protein FWK35_00014753, partial [Aphis craccivora]
CVLLFFVCSVRAYGITCQNNSSISNFGVCFRWRSEYPWYIIEVNIFQQFLKKSGKTKNNVMEKREFLSKASFR